MSPDLRGRAHRVAPLSFAQERLWFIDAAAPGSPVYNVPLLVRWTERVDTAALGSALAAVVERHEVLRSRYELRDGRPVQAVLDAAVPPVEVIEAAGSPEAVVEQARRRARDPFDLAAGAPLRCTLWRAAGLSGTGDTMLLTVHHIALDGWSLAVLFGDLAAAYGAARAGREPRLPALPVQYADYAAEDRERFAAPETRRLLDQRVAELLAVPSGLPLGEAGPPAGGPEGRREGRQQTFAVPAELWDEVLGLAGRLRATPFVVALAAFQAVLARWSGRPEFLVGTVVANRPDAVLEELVGFFVNTVPLRCRPRPEQTFAELCTEVRTEAFGALRYQRLPYDQVVAAANVAAAGRGALVEVGFALQNMPPPPPNPYWEPPVLLPTGTAKFDLVLILDVTVAGVVGTVEHATGRYSTDVAAELADNLLVLLAAAVADPDRPVGTLPIRRPVAGPVPNVLIGPSRDLVAEWLAGRAREVA